MPLAGDLDPEDIDAAVAEEGRGVPLPEEGGLHLPRFILKLRLEGVGNLFQATNQPTYPSYPADFPKF